MKKVIIALMSLLIVSCSSINIKKPSFINKPEILRIIEKERYPEAVDYPRNDNVLIYYNTEVEILFDRNDLIQVTKVHVLKRIFKNIVNNSKISVPLLPDDEILYLQGRTFNNDSVSSILKDDDISEITMKSKGEEKESKLVSFAFPHIKENSVIEYVYIIKSKNSYLGRVHELQLEEQPAIYNNIRIGLHKSLYSFYTFFRIGNYVTALTIPLSISYSINAHGLKGNENPKSYKIGEFSYFQWTFRDIPAFIKEEDMPPISYIQPKIEFQPTKKDDWEDVVRPYEREIKQFLKDSINPIVKNKSKEIVGQESDKLKKVQLLTDYVKSIRYENNRFGEGGYIPLNPEVVIEKNYGDCKDKSMLLYHLLKSEGITAYPALVMTNDQDILVESIPMWKFNHMIVYVELDSTNKLWIDPTVSKCKLGEIPANIQGGGSVLLNYSLGGNRNYKIIPENNHLENNLLIKYHADILNIDSVKFDVRMIMKGEFALMFRNIEENVPESEIKDLVKNFMNIEFRDSDLKNFKIHNLDSLDQDLVITYDFYTLRNIKKVTQNLYSIDIDPFKKYGSSSWLHQSSSRVHPLYFGFLYSLTKEATINIGENLKLKEIPIPNEITNKYVDFNKMTFSENDKKIEMIENFVNKQIIIKSEEYTEVKKTYLDIKKSQDLGIIVEL